MSTRLPAVGETWRGVVHSSLYKVLGVEDQWVTYLVMHQGNDYWMQEKPPGSVDRIYLEGWLIFLAYAPEWNEPGM